MTITRMCALVLGLLLALGGCRRRDPYTDAYLEIVSAEKRDLEDQIYALEDQLEEAKRELARAQARTSRPLRSSPRGSSAPSTPKAEPDVGPIMDDNDLIPPMIDPGVPVEPKIELPPIEATPSRPSVRPFTRPPAAQPMSTQRMKPEEAPEELEPTPDPQTGSEPEELPEGIQASAEEELPPEVEAAPQAESAPTFRKPSFDEAELIDTEIASLFINPFRTAGVDLDQQPGDDGLELLIEPRNAAGQFVPQAGNMTVVVLDPAAEGDAARVARWEISKTEVGRRMLDTRPERGIRMQLKWPEKRPEHAKLKLFVRYEAPDGRLIESHSDVFIALPGQLSQRWTPRRQ